MPKKKKKFNSKSINRNTSINKEEYSERVSAIIENAQKLLDYNLGLREIKEVRENIKLIQSKSVDDIKKLTIKCTEEMPWILQLMGICYEVSDEDDACLEIYDRVAVVIKNLNVFNELDEEEHLAETVLMLITQMNSPVKNQTGIVSQINNRFLNFEIVVKLFRELKAIRQFSKHCEKTRDNIFYNQFFVISMYQIGEYIGFLALSNNNNEIIESYITIEQQQMESKGMSSPGNNTMH